MLAPDMLREIDDWVLSLLREGRITPLYACRRIADEHDTDYSRSYIQQRLVRFAEHGHVENLDDTGLYELVDDPGEDDE